MGRLLSLAQYKARIIGQPVGISLINNGLLV